MHFFKYFQGLNEKKNEITKRIKTKINKHRNTQRKKERGVEPKYKKAKRGTGQP